ncbi:hypothetical protein FSP39_022754 [Pinctada imbricata]|uniref:WD repeat-containing protein on Y chromosome n=1 Tax=Pinctada imbricata TaxID=66713 RepID=A0AA88Y0X5_PINIB|nr:hypothetical protein FSP39_022754 [Pinctada imbricata]
MALRESKSTFETHAEQSESGTQVRSRSTYNTVPVSQTKPEVLESSRGLDSGYSNYSSGPHSRIEKKDFNPEVEATNERYAQLQAIFEAADEDGRPGLSIDEFKTALRKTVGYNMTDNELELLFMKVDANCDGTVDWEEYVTYNLLEYKERTQMIEMLRDRPFPQETKEIPSRHRDTIVRVAVYPTVHKKASKCVLDYSTGRFVTLSKEGIISFWTPKMKLVKTDVTHPHMDRSTHPWITDLACLYNVNQLAVSSTDRDIIVFDIQANKFTKRYHLTGIDSCITVMNFWANMDDLNHAVLLFGDTSGCVYVIIFETALKGGLFGAIAGKQSAFKKVNMAEVLRGFLLGVKGYRMGKLHENWVTQILYMPSLNMFASCSQTSDTSMYVGDLMKKKMSSYFKVNKGLLTFDYCPDNNVLVTGGMDYLIRIWNPYVNSKPVVVLKGHTKPINHVIINSPRNQIISVDKGKNIKVFSMKDQTCVQQLSGRIVKLGPTAISSVCFNPATQKLVLATSQIEILERSEEDEKCIEVYSHRRPVTAALYNPVFKTVVSACRGSVISVWELKTGEKVIQFVNAHKIVERGVEYPVEITTMTFDGPCRRLITGARDGSVKVWNFNNGACLQQFDVPGGLTITSIVSTHHRIYITGWCQLVHIYVDGGGEEYRKNWRNRHTDDILCMSHMNPNIMATGSYNGDVIIWSRDTGQMYCKLNAFSGTKPFTDTAHALNAEQKLDEEDESVEDDRDQSLSPSWKGSKATKAVRTGIGLLQKIRHVARGVQGFPKEDDESRTLESPLNHPLLSSIGDKSEPLQSKREEYDDICKSYEAAVEQIVFLNTRDQLHRDTASLVTCGSEGWVRFWSLHHQGGLLGQFNAAHSVGESVHAMVTDDNNQFLITADTAGYVKVWEISEYCTKDTYTLDQREKRWNELLHLFSFMRFEWRGKDVPKQFSFLSMRPCNIGTRPPPMVTEPQKTLRWPLLVNSFRAHIRMINTIDYVNDRKVIITASEDSSIRVWALHGGYIGTFGETWPVIDKILTKGGSDVETRIPNDLRRVGSARTLRVLSAGQPTQKWKSAVSVIKARQMLEMLSQFEQAGDDDQPRKDERTEKKLEASNILGKSYKRKVRHKIPADIPKVIETPTSIAVYHALKFVELTDLDKLFDQKLLEDMKLRRYGGNLVSKVKGPQKKKSNEPAIIEIFNKVTKKPTIPVPKFRKQPTKMKKIHASLREKMDNNLPPFSERTEKESQT